MKSHDKRAELRKEAEERQALRDSRTVEEQLALLKTRPGRSQREFERLMRMLASGASAPKQEPKQERKSKVKHKAKDRRAEARKGK